jgi:hypothetical protein
MKRLARCAALAATIACVLVPAATAGTVTTYPSWDQSTGVSPYGGGGTPTYGETVTGDGETLQSFTFWMNPNGGSVEARGGIGVWDGSKITSILWLDSTAQTVSGSGYQAVSFAPGVTLQSGVTYVLFSTALVDGGSGSALWGLVPDDSAYAGGSFVFSNDDGSGSCPGVGCESALLNPWDGVGWNVDLAFSMQLGTVALQVDRLGYCSAPGDTDPNGQPIPVGTFLDLAAGQPNTDPHYAGATLALYYDGLGLSCDHLPGYTATGELVGLNGHGDDAGGLYPFLAKNA